MGKVRAVILDPYFEQPPWFSKVEYRKTIYLSEDSTPEDAILFITLVCGYNNIELDKSPAELIHELLSIDEAAISGGIAFETADNVIFPGCCCGLEDWKNVLEAVINKKDVWLGHDPFPSIEYVNDRVRVWSDDFSGIKRKVQSHQEIENMYYMEFERNDLISKLRAIEIDLLEFYEHSVEKQLRMVDEKLRKKLYLKYCEWLHLEAR